MGLRWDLQMQYAVFDLLGTALIPELGADVTAGPSGNAHFVLVAIAAVRAFPDELAVFVFDDLDLSIIAADHAVVALGIQLCVHDIFIDVLHDGENGRDIRLHVRDFDVGDRTARGELLEIGFKFQLVEGVDIFRDVDVVAVRDVVLICDAFDEAEAFLEAFGEFVGGRFHRGAVDGVGNVFLGSPFAAGVIQLLHDGHGEFPSLFRGVGDTEHADAHFIQAGIAEGNGAVVIEEELIDRLALLQTGECAVLPEDRCDVRDGAEEPLVAAAKCAMAELEAVFQDLPEAVHVAAGGAGDVDEIDGDDALIEAAVVLVLAILAKAFGIRCEEAAAAHAWVDIAIFHLSHDLGGNVVRHHALGGTFRSELCEVVVGGILMDIVFIKDVDELREGRCDPYALFILDALHALAKDFFDDEGEVLPRLAVFDFIKVHEHGDEGRLSVAGHEGDELVLDGLDARLDLFLQAAFHDLGDDGFIHRFAGFPALCIDLFFDLLAADVYEGSEVCEGEGLSAVLVRSDLRDDLRRDIARGEEGVRLFDHGLADDGAILQHVFQIDEVTVVLALGEIVGVMEMDDALFVCFHDLLREQQAAGEVFRYFAGHVVTLCGIDDRVLIRVFLLHFFIAEVDEGEDPVIGGIALSGDLAFVAVADVLLRHLVAAHFHDARFDHVLNVFHIAGMRIRRDFLGDVVSDGLDLEAAHLMDAFDFLIGFANGIHDLGNIKSNFLSISLYYVCFDCDSRRFFSIFHS